MFCYLHEACIKVNIVKLFSRLVELNIIDEECYILDANRLLKYFGSELRVVRGINNSGNTIVPFRYKENEHFVVVNDKQEVVFNSLENSRCVELGEPVWEKARYLA